METDSRLQQAIRQYISERPDVANGDLSVEVLGGVVTLSGRMRSDVEKWQIEDAIRAMPGVTALANHTMIDSENATGAADSDVARPFFPST